MTKKQKDADYYLNLNWQFEIMKHENGQYSAAVKGIDVYSGGNTAEEAAENIQEALRFYITSNLEEGLPVEEPVPFEIEKKASGRISARISKSTHIKLLLKSEEEGVSISSLIDAALNKCFA